MNKTAVDKATQEYWSNYFKEYGEMWVRNIPRRIKNAMTRVKDLGIKTAEGHIVPLAHNVANDGTLSIEAAFDGMLDNKSGQAMIFAEFTNEGRMRSLEAVRI